VHGKFMQYLAILLDLIFRNGRIAKLVPNNCSRLIDIWIHDVFVLSVTAALAYCQF
jgi:hypothetical protein